MQRSLTTSNGRRNPVCPVLILMMVLPFCWGTSFAEGPSTASIATTDVSRFSPAFSTAIAGVVKNPIHMEFLTDTEIVVSSVDAIDAPVFAARDRRSLKPIHLTLDFFSLDSTALRHSDQMRFDTVSHNERMRALPSGRFLVNADKNVLLYDSKHQLVAKRAAEDICEFKSSPQPDMFYDAYLNAGSESVGVLNLLFEDPASFAIGPDARGVKPRKTGGGYCWFSIDTLKPIANFETPLSFPSASAVDTEIYDDTPGLTKSISPEGVHDVTAPAGCRSDLRYINDQAGYLLHRDHAIAFVCVGELRVNTPSQTYKVKLRTPAVLRSAAWNAPVVAVVNESVKIGFLGLGSGFRSNSRIEVVNYVTGKTLRLPSVADHAPPPIYTGGVLEVALSPSGTYVAVLSGSALAVYPTGLVPQP